MDKKYHLHKIITKFWWELSNIEHAVEPAPDMPKIIGDFGQIQQVFLNIISNAEQAITEANGGGEFAIKT